MMSLRTLGPVLGLLACAAVATAGCSSDDSADGAGGAGGEAGDAGAGDAADSWLDKLPGPPEPGEWIEIEPGGETTCARGTPYRFFVRGGASDNVIIDFRGGGACWDEMTCRLAGAAAIFAEEADELSAVESRLGKNGFGGIYNESSPDYPFKDWTLVHIQYCTGDVHWGDNDKQYADDLAVKHKGFVNASAVLQWVYRHYQSPERVLVNGCSAGAYGAILHSAFIADQYPDAELRVLSDSGAGIITSTFFEDSFPNWNATPNLPPNVERLQKPPSDLTSADLYAGVASAYPKGRFAHFSSKFDQNQTFYYVAMGGQKEDWPGEMTARMKEVRKDADNFRYYIAPGPVHCITPYEFMFQKTGTSPFVSWLSDFVFGDKLPDDVECTGQDCFDDSVCDGCASSGNADVHCGFCTGWPQDYQASN